MNANKSLSVGLVQDETFATNIAILNFDLGMDMLKHGESAYPADAWVEQQYMREDSETTAVTSIPRQRWVNNSNLDENHSKSISQFIKFNKISEINIWKMSKNLGGKSILESDLKYVIVSQSNDNCLQI